MPPVSCGERKKKSLSILKPVEVLSSPLLMWLFQCVWKHWRRRRRKKMHTPGTSLRPPSLKQNQGKHSARQRSEQSNKKKNSKVSFPSCELCLNLFRHGSWQRKTQALLSKMMWRNATRESRCWCFNLGTFADRYHWRPALHHYLSLRGMRLRAFMSTKFLMATRVASKEFSKHGEQPTSSIVRESSSGDRIRLYYALPCT